MNQGFQITVVGSGYVGMSMAVLLARHNNVTVLDIDNHRVDCINSGVTTVQDNENEKILKSVQITLSATTYSEKLIAMQDIIVATPTNLIRC